MRQAARVFSCLTVFVLVPAVHGAGAPPRIDAHGTGGAKRVFVRSDQVHLGRSLKNTQDLSKMVTKDFSGAAADAAKVIAWLKENPTKHPVYLGCIHAWDYNDKSEYRANVHTLAKRVTDATDQRVLLYFEERNAEHQPREVRPEFATALRVLSKKATLLMATYANGGMSRAEVLRAVKHFHDYYADRMGISPANMMIDVDTSQTPSNFYYGSRGRLTHFNQVIGWALRAAYAMHFGGFHTMGNVTANYGTQVAHDSTYAALDHAWQALEAAHPNQTFPGTRPD